MTKGNLRAAKFVGNAIKNAAAKSCAERADVFAFRNQSLDDGVRILIFYVIRNAGSSQLCLERFKRKLRDMLMHIDRNEIEANGRSRSQGLKRVKKHIAVFAAAHRNQHFVTFFDHVEVGNGLCS